MPKKIEQPVPVEPANSDDFAEALRGGDASKVADVLLRMGGLSQGDCQLLADHLTDKPLPYFPFRLKFVSRRRGRPAGDALQTAYDNARIERAFRVAYAESGKYKSAVKQVMSELNFKRTRVTRVVGSRKSK